LHGVSVGVPFVFTAFDWKDAATKLNLATSVSKSRNAGASHRQLRPGEARFQKRSGFIVTVLSSSRSQLQCRCGFRFVHLVKAKRL
jgi:hypothetical protein